MCIRDSIWVDTLYVGDSTTSVPSGATEHSIKVSFKGEEKLYDTLDLTPHVQDYLKQDSLSISIWCDYGDGQRSGDIQHIFIHFGDDLPPSLITITDSVWTTGAAIDWSRPTDQRDYYVPESLSGPIAGYNILLWSENENQDIRNIKVKISHDGKVDSLGNTLWKRHHRFRFTHDSL